MVISLLKEGCKLWNIKLSAVGYTTLHHPIGRLGYRAVGTWITRKMCTYSVNICLTNHFWKWATSQHMCSSSCTEPWVPHHHWWEWARMGLQGGATTTSLCWACGACGCCYCSLTLLSSFSPTFVRISSPFIRSSEYESQSQWQLYKPMRDDFWPAIAGNISVQCFHPKRNWSRNESKKDADEAVRLWGGCLSCMCAPTRGIALHKDHLAQGVTSSTSQSHLACIYSDFLSRKELLKWMLGRMEASSARSDCVSAWLWSTALQLMWGHPIIVKKQNPGVLGPFHMPLSGCPPDLPTWRSLWEQWNVPLHPLLWLGSPAQSCRILFVCL